MSRGPGKWERAILDALGQVPAFYLTDLLPTPHTRSQTVALNRAARNLADAGKVQMWKWAYYGGGNHERGYIAPSPAEFSGVLSRCAGALVANQRAW